LSRGTVLERNRDTPWGLHEELGDGASVNVLLGRMSTPCKSFPRSWSPAVDNGSGPSCRFLRLGIGPI
jgi:hypothetical protein